jgi:hypothetical protein
MRSTHSSVRTAAILAAILSFAVLVSAPLHVSAQPTNGVSETAVKAAYLYQFAAYVEWPADRFEHSASPLSIGVIAMDPMVEDLVEITRGRTLNGRRIEVQSLGRDEPLTGLHILFIAADSGARIREITAAAQDESILTLTDSDDAASEGSVINFRVVESRVRFEVFLEQAERNRLKLNSRLLAVALQVHMGPMQ